MKKTLYGLRQLPRAIWEYMVERMEECKYKQSSLDPCLFIGKKVICIIYVDDIIFVAQDKSYIIDLAMMLRGKGVDLEQEDHAAGFLGVTLERDKDTNIFEMKQTSLIDPIIGAMGLEDATPKLTLSEGALLVKNAEGENTSG